MRRILALTLAMALPLGLSACKDDGTGPNDDLADGTFEASVSGGVTADFTGQAFFGEANDPGSGESYWVLILTSGSENSGRTIYFGRLGSRPGTGTAEIADISTDEPETGEVFSWFFDYTSQTLAGAFGSTDGVLTITESSGDQMTGSFTIAATGTAIQNGEAVEVDISITGSFDAQSGNVGLPGTF